MPDLFSARELIEVAITEEQTGATYYRALAEATDSADLQQFATAVATMEDDHERKFRDLLQRVGDYQAAGESYTGEYQSYMSYMTEGRIFPRGQEGAELARRQASDLDAVQTAMEMERNTLLFYHELTQFVPDRERALLAGIIAEERQHLTDLARYRDAHT